MEIRKLRNWKLQIFFLIAIIALISGCSQAPQSPASFTEPPSAPPASISAEPSIALRIDFGDGTIPVNFQVSIFNFQTTNLWPIIQQTLTEDGITLEYEDYGGELGVLITRIGDKKNGEGGRYWQYFVNGEYAKVGVSNYKVKAGDVVEWKFTNDKLKTQNSNVKTTTQKK